MDGTIIRVGGRLKKSQLDYDQKHPVLLYSTNHISQLIMEDVHHKVSHAGRKEPWVKAAESFGLYVEEALPRNSLETVQFVASYASCHTPL